MQYFDKTNEGRTIVVHLKQGDYVLESINDVIEKTGIKNGFIASAIGTLDYCVLHMVTTTGYPPVEVYPEWKDAALELVSIDGIIADGKPHLHAVISDDKKAVAGHLEPGCRILYLGEIVIKELLGQEFTRVKNDKQIDTLVKKI